MSLEQLSREELAAELSTQLKESKDKEGEHERALHDLRVHQVELELQNRHLREAQNALEESRARFEELYDFAPVAYYTLDLRGCVLEVNLTGATMVGRDRAEIIGKPFLAFLEMEPAPFWRHLRLCSETRKPVASELRFSIKGRDRRSVHALSVPVLDESGRAIAFRTAFTDITARVEAEDALDRLRRQERRLRRGFEGLDRASVTLNEAQLSAASANDLWQIVVDQAREIADAEVAALGIVSELGDSFVSWIFSGLDPDRAAAIGLSPRPLGLLGEVATIERSIRLPDLPERAASRGLMAQHPELRSFLGVPIFLRGRSIATLYLANKRLGEEFADDDQRFVEMLTSRAMKVLETTELTDQVKRAVRARDDLLAIVSHDLRSPLSAIGLSAELLGLPPPGGERRATRKQVQLIRRSAARMTSLIEDLLQASTIEAGTFTVTLGREEVPALVDEALAAIEPLALGKSIELGKEIPAELPPIRGDRLRVIQVLSNLLGNAVKFASDQRARVTIGAQERGREVCFTVSDNGPGISQENVSHVFDRYWKGKADGRHGVGLGLFIAQGIVTAHGGRLWVESRLGEGSSFHFTIPIAKEGGDE